MKDKVKVIKKEDQEPKRIRPEVMRRLLLDEKATLTKRLKKIERELRTV